MRRSRIVWIFYSSFIGLFLAITIREKFDGVAFLMAFIAASAFFMGLYLKEVEYLNHNKPKEAIVVGRCSYCHHIRGLYKEVMAQHTYLGSAICPGSGKPPIDSVEEEETHDFY